MRQLKTRLPIELKIIFGVIVAVGVLGMSVWVARPSTNAWQPAMPFILTGLAGIVWGRFTQTIWLDEEGVRVRRLSLATWPICTECSFSFSDICRKSERAEPMTRVGQRFLHESIIELATGKSVCFIQTAFIESESLENLRRTLRDVRNDRQVSSPSSASSPTHP